MQYKSTITTNQLTPRINRDSVIVSNLDRLFRLVNKMNPKVGLVLPCHNSDEIHVDLDVWPLVREQATTYSSSTNINLQGQLVGSDDTTFDQCIVKLLGKAEPVLSDLEHKNYECGICKQVAMINPIQHSLSLCGRLFCKECLSKWVLNNQSCPCCQVNIRPDCVYCSSSRVVSGGSACNYCTRLVNVVSASDHMELVPLKCPIDNCNRTFINRFELRSHLVNEYFNVKNANQSTL